MSTIDYTPTFATGTRVEAHPATDAWMRGDRFGTVTSTGWASRSKPPGGMREVVYVRMDRSGRTLRFSRDNLLTEL